MHNISKCEIYLEKMARYASNNIPLGSRGLWGDIFCIHWLSNWLKIPIRFWSKTKIRIYLHFNSSVAKNTHDILFHDKDPLNGHLKPLVRRHSTMDCTFQQQRNTSYEQMNLSSKQDKIETCLLRSEKDTSEIILSHATV